MSVPRCSICGGFALDCHCHLGEEPPSDHLGIAHPRPVCQVCRRKPATAEAAPDVSTGVYDARAIVRVCDDGDCRAMGAARVQARLDEITGRTSSVPPCRLQTGVYAAARGGR